MKAAQLEKLAASVRTGGKGSVRRKHKAVHKTTGSDDKRIQQSLKSLHVNPISGIEEVIIQKNDDTIIKFQNPKVQASVEANTYVVTGKAETRPMTAEEKNKQLQEMLGMFGNLNPDQFKKIAEQVAKAKEAEGAAPTPASDAPVSTRASEKEDDMPALISEPAPASAPATAPAPAPAPATAPAPAPATAPASAPAPEVKN